MLFHITMTHTAEDCPGYNPDKMPEIISSAENMDKIAEDLNAKVLFYVEGAPEHVSFALIEAESLTSVIGFANQIPFRQDFKVTAVTHLKDLIAFVKTLGEKRE